MPTILKVVIEYSPTQQRVMVRGVFPHDTPTPEPLAPENQQNIVRVFEGVDMGPNVGFAGLVPSAHLEFGSR
jgi:hypothetical protein